MIFDAHDTATLRLLATTDLHMQIHDFNYAEDRPDPGHGLLALRDVIDKARAECPNCLLLDNGDTFLGGAFGEVFAEPGPNRAHPMVALMNALRYDAATLGNHDLELGADALGAILSAAAFPYVCANLENTQAGPAIRPTVMLQRDLRTETGARASIKIGVTGLLPEMACLPGAEAGPAQPDNLSALADAVADLRSAGAEVVVVLCHGGFSEDETRPPDHRLANRVAALAGVDAVVAGHIHGHHPNKADARAAKNSAAVVMPGAHGDCLGVIDLTLICKTGGWRVAASQCSLRRAPIRKGAAKGRDHTHARQVLEQPLAPIDRDLHAHFALISDCAATGLVAGAKMSALSNWAEGNGKADLPRLVTVSPFRTTGDAARNWPFFIPKGAFCERHVHAIYPYRNRFAALEVTGRDIREWIERSASIFRTLRPNESPAARFYDFDRPSYNFDIFYGLSFAIDPTVPPRYDRQTGRLLSDQHRRVRNLIHDGHALGDEDRFLVGAADFRALGGGNFPHVGRGATIHETGWHMHDVLRQHIVGGAGILTSDWRFEAPDRTFCAVDLHADARRFLDQIDHLTPRVTNGPRDGVISVALRL